MIVDSENTAAKVWHDKPNALELQRAQLLRRSVFCQR